VKPIEHVGRRSLEERARAAEEVCELAEQIFDEGLVLHDGPCDTRADDMQCAACASGVKVARALIPEAIGRWRATRGRP
jgi:hypothetical protein